MNSLDFFTCQVNLLADNGIEDIILDPAVVFPGLAQPFVHLGPLGGPVGGAGVFPDGQFPLAGRLDGDAFFEEHGRPDDAQVAAEEGLVGGKSFGPPVLEDVHEEGDDVVVP